MSSWAENGTWEGDGLRREVFFFSSGGVELYGSLYAALEPTRPWGVVACGSWGAEADRTESLLRSAVIATARLGGAGLVFHYPGYGDSHGDLADVGLDDLTGAACAAAGEASRRCPDLDWILAGFMFGASVACLAQEQLAVKRLLLVQPALRPGAYLKHLTRTRRPLAPGPSPRAMLEVGAAPGMAYGYPVPRRIVERAAEADGEVEAALARFGGDGAVIRHTEPAELVGLPARFETVEVSGSWRFGSLSNADLDRAATDWLDRRAGGERG